jgi:hypothetical protein
MNQPQRTYRSEPPPPVALGPFQAKTQAGPSLIGGAVGWQLGSALLCGIVLVGVPLYMWRRPAPAKIPAPSMAAAEALPAATDAPRDGLATAVLPKPLPEKPANPAKPASSPSMRTDGVVAISDVRVLRCAAHPSHGSRPGAAECDHLPAVEQTLRRAIERTAACVPVSASGGTVEYVAEIQFGKKHPLTHLSTPRQSRGSFTAKTLATCRAALKRELSELSVDRLPHQHDKYTLSVDATYPESAH